MTLKWHTVLIEKCLTIAGKLNPQSNFEKVKGLHFCVDSNQDDVTYPASSPSIHVGKTDITFSKMSNVWAAK